MLRFVPILAMAILAGSCASKPTPGPLPSAWNIGFWRWHGGEPAPGPPVDVLYYHSGGIRKDRDSPWQVFGDLPTQLPRARAYWLVFRYDGSGIPSTETVPLLAKQVRDLKFEALSSASSSSNTTSPSS